MGGFSVAQTEAVLAALLKVSCSSSTIANYRMLKTITARAIFCKDAYNGLQVSRSSEQLNRDTYSTKVELNERCCPLWFIIRQSTEAGGLCCGVFGVTVRVRVNAWDGHL